MEQPKNVLPPTVFTKTKRNTIRAALAFCAGTVVYCLLLPDARAIHETAVEWSFITASGIIGAYVFGAAWQGRK